MSKIKPNSAKFFKSTFLGAFFLSIFLILSLLSDNMLYFSICLAALSCILPLAVVNFQATSFISIVAITHLISFPLPAFFALFLEVRYVAIEDYLWFSTPYAMYACALGMIGLAVGSRLALDSRNISFSAVLTRPFANFLMIALLIFPVGISYMNGFYYHSTVTGTEAFNTDSANTFGFTGYFLWISVAGILLQLSRYFTTRKPRDLFWVGIFTAIYVVLLAPSGSRIRLFTGLAVLFASFWNWEKRKILRLGVLCGAIMFFSFSAPFIESYRTNAVSFESDSNFFSRLNLLTDFGSTGIDKYSDSDEAKSISLVRRMADYVGVGQIISVVPETYPFRGTYAMGEWWVYLIPTLLRPATTLSFTEGADWAQYYGVRPDSTGSSPLMLLGDLYSRFSWIGVFLGMIMIGYILRKMEKVFCERTTSGLIFYVTMAQQIVSLYTYSLLVCFTFFTRQLIIIWFISMVFSKLLNKYGKA